MGVPFIKLEHVEYYYDKGKSNEVRALKDINIEIEIGEYAAFFGPSGCGKSTLLYIIAGIERPTSGRVLVKGKDLMEMTEQELTEYRQTGVGIIFQNFNLIPSISVRENIAMPLAFIGFPASARNGKADEIAERLGIDAYKNRFPFELSGGQQQRVGIARALANGPDLILADEPLGNLDSENANAVLDYIEEFHARDGQTVIMVTHEAWSLRGTQKIFHMKDGEIIKTEAHTPQKGVAPARKSVNAELTLATPETRAKAVAQFVLRGHSAEEVSRIEQLLNQLFREQINADEFEANLHKPFKEGGVGLYRASATKITRMVSEFIAETKVLEDAYKKIVSGPAANLLEDIRNIRRWIMEDFSTSLNEKQQARMDTIILERLKGGIPTQEVVHKLNLSAAYGGVGIRIGTALHIAEKLETLLGEKTASLTTGHDIPIIPSLG